MLPQHDDEQVTCLKSFLEQENRLLHEAPMEVLEREESEAEDEQDPSKANHEIGWFPQGHGHSAEVGGHAKGSEGARARSHDYGGGYD